MASDYSNDDPFMKTTHVCSPVCQAFVLTLQSLFTQTWKTKTLLLRKSVWKFMSDSVQDGSANATRGFVLENKLWATSQMEIAAVGTDLK